MTQQQDEKTDFASYTVLSHDREVYHTVQVSECCFVDIDEKGYPVGVEVIHYQPTTPEERVEINPESPEDVN